MPKFWLNTVKNLFCGLLARQRHKATLGHSFQLIPKQEPNPFIHAHHQNGDLRRA